jgi:hypothetical protein
MSSSLLRFGSFAVILVFLMNFLLAVLPAFGQADDTPARN